MNHKTCMYQVQIGTWTVRSPWREKKTKNKKQQSSGDENTENLKE